MKISIGKAYRHPIDGPIYVDSGAYYDAQYGRLSNFWTWRKITPSGDLGEKGSGYGGDWPEIRVDVEVKVFILEEQGTGA